MQERGVCLEALSTARSVLARFRMIVFYTLPEQVLLAETSTAVEIEAVPDFEETEATMTQRVKPCSHDACETSH